MQLEVSDTGCFDGGRQEGPQHFAKKLTHTLFHVFGPEPSPSHTFEILPWNLEKNKQTNKQTKTLKGHLIEQ